MAEGDESPREITAQRSRRSVAKRSVAVEIAGQRYVVRSDADETYVRMLAAFLSEQIEEVSRTLRVVPTQKLVVLAALNIVDALFKERRDQVELKQRVRERSQALLAYVEREEKRISIDAE